MIKTEARDAILNYLFQIYEPYGFKIQKKDYRIYKKTQYGWLAIALPMWDYNPLIKFNFLFQVRHHIINNAFEDYHQMDQRYRNAGPTMVTHLCSLIDDALPFFKKHGTLKTDGDFQASSIEELEELLGAIKKYIMIGIDYFEKYSDLLKVHERLNLEHKDEMIYPYHGHLKLLIAYHCDRNVMDAIHHYNLEKMNLSLDSVKEQYINFYKSLLNKTNANEYINL